MLGFGIYIMLLGLTGLISVLSLTFKAVQEEADMFGNPVHFEFLDFLGRTGPYIFCLIGGGVMIISGYFSEISRTYWDINQPFEKSTDNSVIPPTGNKTKSKYETTKTTEASVPQVKSFMIQNRNKMTFKGRGTFLLEGIIFEISLKYKSTDNGRSS